MKKRSFHNTRPAQSSRRQFLTQSTAALAATTLASTAIPFVHAADDSTIRLALIGCGGRGTGAAGQALSVPGVPSSLYAMADLFPDRLNSSLKSLKNQHPAIVDVSPDRQFIGFDAYRKAIDCLRPGDVVLCTTHAAFRAIHVEYAIQKGINVFMEKNFAADPGGVQQILRAAEAAEKKGVRIACGLMCRHSTARQAIIQKIRDGALGDIHLIRAYRMDPGIPMGPFKGGESEVLWQIRRPYQFHWASSGLFLELMIHQIDECCWIKDSYPVTAHGVGGRAPNSQDCSQNLDSYNVEYTFADGAKALVTGRYIRNCHNEFATFVHGTKCAGQFSGDIHAPTVRTYRDQRIAGNNIDWKPQDETINPWQAEWNVFLNNIRNDKPHNEARRAALSNLAAIMGRAAVHMGRIITWDEMTKSNYRFCPDVAALKADGPAPVRADAQGRYPVPVPGAWTEI